MRCFRVWAPFADRVELLIQGQTRDMRRANDGWWQVQEEAEHGTDYTFRLDEGPPLPDPRSRWQPEGVHGPSRVFDAGRFHWRDANWQPPPLAAAVIYELHVGTFTEAGTFAAAASRLGHLLELGVTHVELMPVNEFTGTRGWGYDGVDLFAPYHRYGGPVELQRFVDTCHGKGLGVILDVVYNHTGPEGSYLESFGPYFTDRYSTPWGEAVNFDGAHSDEVRRFVLDNIRMWVQDYHVDALRLDAIHAIFDTSAVHIIEAAAAELDRVRAVTGRHVALICESALNNPRIIQSRERGGYGADAQWNDDFHHAVHAFLTGERDGYYMDYGGLAAVEKALTRAYVLDGVYSPFRERHHGRPIGSLPGDRFIVFLQNHDQVGNRARGARLGHLLSPARAKQAAALLLTAPFVPMLFQGEEWGASTPFQYFAHCQDPELATAVSEGRRKEFEAFGWKPEEVPDPQDEQTWRRSVLDWAERDQAPHRDMLDWYKALLRLRRETPDLRVCDLQAVRTESGPQEDWLVVQRGRTAVVFNFSQEHRLVPLDNAAGARVLLAAGDGLTLQEQGVRLPADGVAVVQMPDGDAGESANHG